MVSALDLTQLSIEHIHLQAIIASEVGVNNTFSSALYTTDSPTDYNSQTRCRQLLVQPNTIRYRLAYMLLQPQRIMSAINSAQLPTAQIHLLPVTAGVDHVSNPLNPILCSTDSLTIYKSQRRSAIQMIKGWNFSALTTIYQ
jgi:hypothetical protein